MMLTADEVAEAVQKRARAPQPALDRTALTPQPPLPQAGEGEPDHMTSSIQVLTPNPRPPAGEGQARSARVRAAAVAQEGPSIFAPFAFTSVSTDTRTLLPGALFVALVNDANDGHAFVPQALAKGAAGLIVSQDVNAPEDVLVLRVPDTEVAYGQVARLWRDKFTVPIVGVTGSVGKTTTKEMLAATLAPLGAILKTAASQNNETGVPKTLLQLDNTHRAAIIEMGMRGRGQIAYLCDIARPTVGVVTLIGENHLELLGTRDAIADAKGELLEALPADGIAVVNRDDPYCDTLRAKTQARVVTYGVDREADYHAQSVRQTDDGWSFSVRGASVTLQTPSRHDIGNSLAALAVAVELGVPLTDAARALGAYAPPPMRMEIIQTPWGGTVLNDAYNAAPLSMRSALQTLARLPGGRKWAFLGDMKELGELGPDAHRELGGVINELGGLHAFYTVGELAALIPGAAGRFADSRAAAEAVASMAFAPGDVVLVKGSRAMAMERVALALVHQENEQR